MRKHFEPNTWRRRYNYVCTQCKRKRTTTEYERMVAALCTVCEPQPVSKDQASLFGNQENNGTES